MWIFWLLCLFHLFSSCSSCVSMRPWKLPPPAHQCFISPGETWMTQNRRLGSYAISGMSKWEMPFSKSPSALCTWGTFQNPESADSLMQARQYCVVYTVWDVVTYGLAPHTLIFLQVIPKLCLSPPQIKLSSRHGEHHKNNLAPS